MPYPKFTENPQKFTRATDFGHYASITSPLLSLQMVLITKQFTGLRTQKAYTNTGTSSSQWQCIHQTLCHLFMHINL